MQFSSSIKRSLPLVLFALVLALCFSTFAHAESVVRITDGVVTIDERGTVWVVVGRNADGSLEEYVPSNGQGLLRSGQIAPGDTVGVRIVQDKGKKYEFRGHVTVLK